MKLKGFTNLKMIERRNQTTVKFSVYKSQGARARSEAWGPSIVGKTAVQHWLEVNFA